MRRLNRAARWTLLMRVSRAREAKVERLRGELLDRMMAALSSGLPPRRRWFQLPACAHPVIREDVRHPDGSVDGKCLDCGERGFPIRDVPWEEFRAALERGDAL